MRALLCDAMANGRRAESMICSPGSKHSLHPCLMPRCAATTLPASLSIIGQSLSGRARSDQTYQSTIETMQVYISPAQAGPSDYRPYLPTRCLTAMSALAFWLRPRERPIRALVGRKRCNIAKSAIRQSGSPTGQGARLKADNFLPKPLARGIVFQKSAAPSARACHRRGPQRLWRRRQTKWS